MERHSVKTQSRMNYTPIEIALIFSECMTEEEVMTACERFRYLILNAGQKHLYLMTRLSTQRIKFIIENEN